MSNVNAPPPINLPSTPHLWRSTIIAIVVAVALVVVAVLPAERGIDPTGMGRVIGLTQVGELKAALAAEFAAEEAAEAEGRIADSLAALKTAAAAAEPATGTAAGAATHVTRVTLRPNEGKEIKLVMRKGARVTYSWATDSGVVNYDTHGDTLNARPGVFHSYGKGAGKQSDAGEFVAVFDGFHGWFWRNRWRAVVTLTLRTTGDYTELREMK